MSMAIRDLRPTDRAQWEPLWQGYQEFYRVALGADVTGTTWQRMMQANEPIHGLGAFDDGALLGIAHFLFHRSTWLTSDTCYLQDLFVVPKSRGRGVAQKLIEAVYAAADVKKAGQVYWLTHESNARARKLYEQLATNAGFIVYELNV